MSLLKLSDCLIYIPNNSVFKNMDLIGKRYASNPSLSEPYETENDRLHREFLEETHKRKLEALLNPPPPLNPRRIEWQPEA